jgi:flagellar basal body-associated protein FliL
MKNRITFILIALIIVALSVLGTYSWLKQTAQLKSAEDAERIAAMKKLENSYYTNLSIVKTHYNIIDFNAFLNNLQGSTNYQAIRRYLKSAWKEIYST